MQNRTTWKPSRIIWDDKRKTYVPNKAVVFAGSYHIAALQLKAYLPLIQEHITGDVLDCGCGTVPYLALYEPAASSITCIDWEPSHGPNPFADYHADLNQGLPLADGSVDSILCADVIAHIYKPHQLFEEFARVLRPGGKLVLFTPFQYWISEPPHDYYRFSRYALEHMCADAGLSQPDIQTYGGQRAIELDVLNKRLTSKWGWRWFRVVRAWKQLWLSDTNPERHPLGYTLVAQKSNAV